MRNWAFASIAIVVAGLAGQAGATPMEGMTGHLSSMKHWPIEKANCVAPGGACPLGRQRQCGPGYCWCAPCGGFWTLWHRYVVSPDAIPPKPQSSDASTRWPADQARPATPNLKWMV